MVNTGDRVSERANVGMIVPPPIALGIALVAVAALPAAIGGYHPLTLHTPAGVVVLVGSAVTLVASERAFRAVGTPVRPTTPALAVVGTGPYRYSRNPMYLAMLGIVTGLGLVTGNHTFIPIAACFAAVLHFGAVRPEERYLTKRFPEHAAAYFQQVRRWL